ncbi:MAG: TonB-dependent receptor [Cyclobacteriaceae bacterium]
MPKTSAFILLSVLSMTMLYAQTHLEGYVMDQVSNVKLEGVLISSPNGTTITDKSGYFQIEANADTMSLSVSHLGYESAVVSTDQSRKLYIRIAPKNTELGEVIVSSGQGFEKVHNVVSSIAVIDSRQLERDAPYTIANSLNRIPGVYMHSGTFNTNRITIRGIGSRSPFATDKIKAYYDQIPLTDGSGNSTLEDFDQSMIQQIEIVKGPNSSLYGAGLGGAILLRSAQPGYNETTIETAMSAGSYNTSRVLTRLQHSSDNLSLNLTYNKLKSDGYRDNNQYEKWQTALTGRYYFNESNFISFIGVFTDLFSEIPSSLNKSDYQNNPGSAAANWSEAQGYEDYTRTFAGLSYQYSPAKNFLLSHSINAQIKDTYEAAPGPFVNIMKEKIGGFSSRHVVNYKQNNWDLHLGFEWFDDGRKFGEFENLHTPTSNGSVEGEKLDDFKENRSYTNWFSEFRFMPTKKLKLVAGLNVNATNYDLKDHFPDDGNDKSGSFGFQTILSPRFGSVYHINEDLHLFGNISHGFSPPNLEQTLYPDGQINPNIQPETGWNYEAGLRGKIGSLTYDVAGYFMDIKNLLVGRRTEQDEYIGVNAGQNHHYGLDISLDYLLQISEGAQLVFFQKTSLMHFRFKNFVDEANDYSGNKLTGVPPVTISSGIELLNKSGFYGNINAQYTGKMPITDDNTLFSESYLLLRSKIGYRKSIRKFTIDANAGVDNITDTKYASMLQINSGTGRYYYPGLPRNYFAGISLKYNFR